MRDQTALLVGGGHSDRPLVHALRSAGYSVVTAGGDPLGLAHALADASRFVDYSDVDAITSVALDLRPNLIAPGANDFAAISANAAGHALELPGLDAQVNVERFHRKDAFRAAAARIGVPVPDQYEPPAVGARFPVIVKPTDMTGGKGVEVVDSIEGLAPAVERARQRSRAKDVVIEEFIRGTHHGVSCLIVRQRVVFAFFDDEFYRPGSFEVGAAATPSSLGSATRASILAAIEAMSEAWTLADGIVHLQVVAREDEWFVIDSCRRIPGDHYPDLVAAASGVDYLAGLVSVWTGNDWSPEQHLTERAVFRLCLTAPTSGRRGAVIFRPPLDSGLTLERLEDVVHVGTHVREGEKIAIALVAASRPMCWSGIPEVERTLEVEMLDVTDV